MTVAHETTSQEFDEKLQAIQQLRELDITPGTLEHLREAGIAEQAVTELPVEVLTEELRLWRRAFELTFKNFDRIEQQRIMNVRFSDSDWNVGVEAADRALNALRIRLATLASAERQSSQHSES